MNKISSVGKCLYCAQTFTKVGIGKHLQKHIQDKLILSKPGKSFLLKIEANPAWGSRPYFLTLWIDGEARINELDDFLRQIWLECCGHMSSFTNPKIKKEGNALSLDFFNTYGLLEQGNIKEYKKIMEASSGEVPMSKKSKQAFTKDLKLIYQYDFGSTTELLVTVINEFPIKADTNIVLLSRNEPLALLCDSCRERTAKLICSACYSYTDEAHFCGPCSKKHAKVCDDFADYAKTPIVNSPRMGVCGYEGGTIDVKRDGN